jgi:hypothetical protein
MAAAEEEPGPLLTDCQRLQTWLGVKRATAERIMRLCDRKVVLGRRVYVYADDVLIVVREHEVRDAA